MKKQTIAEIIKTVLAHDFWFFIPFAAIRNKMPAIMRMLPAISPGSQPNLPIPPYSCGTNKIKTVSSAKRIPQIR
ncbi:hypothetical protein J7L68_00780 [bacterium]|nr:hypothetical protein [bacterium]